MALEQTVQFYECMNNREGISLVQCRVEGMEINTEGGLYVLLSGCPPPSGGRGGSGFARLTIYDLPSLNAQLHIHSSKDGNIITEGNLVANENPEEIRRTINGYESAMADYYARMFGLKTIVKDNK